LDAMTSIGTMGIWIGVFTALLFAFCLYFSLTYFEYLKDGDQRLIRQSKIFAVLTLLLALLLPAIYQVFLYNQMMNMN